MGAFRGGRGAACERGRTRLQERTEDWFSERLGGGVTHARRGAVLRALRGAGETNGSRITPHNPASTLGVGNEPHPRVVPCTRLPVGEVRNGGGQRCGAEKGRSGCRRAGCAESSAAAGGHDGRTHLRGSFVPHRRLANINGALLYIWLQGRALHDRVRVHPCSVVLPTDVREKRVVWRFRWLEASRSMVSGGLSRGTDHTRARQQLATTYITIHNTL